MQNLVDNSGIRVILMICPVAMGTCERACERTKHYRSHDMILKYKEKLLNVNVFRLSRARMRKIITFLSLLISTFNLHLCRFLLAGDSIFRSLVHIFKKIIIKQNLIVGTNEKMRSHVRSHVHMTVYKSMLLKASSQNN